MSNSPIASRRTLLGGVFGATALGGALAAASGQSASAVSVPSAPGSNFFLEIPDPQGIPGGSTNEFHENAIEILDWSIGLDMAANASKGGGAAGKPAPRPFTAVARSGIASPKLLVGTATGRSFPVVKFYGATGDGASERARDYLVITLKNVIVTSFATAPDDTDATPTDVFEMVYGSLLMSWTPQRPDGRPGTPVVGGFDFEKNRPL